MRAETLERIGIAVFIVFLAVVFFSVMGIGMRRGEPEVIGIIPALEKEFGQYSYESPIFMEMLRNQQEIHEETMGVINRLTEKACKIANKCSDGTIECNSLYDAIAKIEDCFI